MRTRQRQTQPCDTYARHPPRSPIPTLRPTEYAADGAGSSSAANHISLPARHEPEFVAVSVVDILVHQRPRAAAKPESMFTKCFNLVEPEDVARIGTVGPVRPCDAEVSNAKAATDHDAPFLVGTDRRGACPAVHVVEEQPWQFLALRADHGAELLPDDEP